MKHSNRLCHKAAGAIAAAAMCAAIPTALLCSAQTLAGDVNVDGNVGVADIILLQKYLLGQASLSQEQFENADVCQEAGVDVYDLAILKRMVIAGQSPDPIDPTDPSEVPTVDPDATGVAASIIYNGSTVTLLDEAGEEIAPDNASNVLVSGSYVTITKAGDYTVSGTSADGQLKVSTDNTAEPTAVVTMSFAGLELSNSTAAPVYIENVGDQAVISVKKDTVNVIQDGTSHTDTYTTSSGEVKTCDAAIFARDDLKIKGKGTMRVIGNSTDGIVCTNDLKIFNSTLEVTAADDGIRGDTVKIGDADDAVAAGGSGYDNLHVTIKAAAGDGIRASSTSEKKGVVTINGGSVDINAYADGIQAEQEFVMQDGDLNIYTYSGSGYTGSGSTGNTGGWGGGMGMDGNANKTDISAKGIKAVGLYDEAGTTYQSGGNITINGGTIQIDSSDDALHCGGDMYIYGGVFTVATADDAFHSDHSLTIGKTAGNTFDDVQIFVSKCYEGVEGATINQNSGTVYIISDDDGYNAAGGSDGSGSTNPSFGPGGGWGQGGMSSSTGTMNLNGGLVIVNSANGDHDAFDSNGNFTITGGYYCANGQEPLDYDGSYSNNGGSVITMTAGNTSLNTRYSFVDDSGNVIVSFLSAGGNAGATVNGCTAQSGGSISGGTSILTQAGEYAVTVGGTLSGASQITGSSSSGGGQRPGMW